ncbi:MAG: crotonase/enoyl-CoA hydratase family protein [Pseudomonadota bacterium]
MYQNLPCLSYQQRADIGVLTLNRPHKRNAINEEFIASLITFFSAPPKEAKVIVIDAAGEHFCAGLDLQEHKETPPFGVMQNSRQWHRAFDLIQFGGVPVVSALRGAVIGGGLELAMATHVRVSEPSTFYELPEGRHGIFVGGGGSVRVGRAIGVGRMVEMMLTGRRYDAQDGLRLGLAHYVEPQGGALEKALALAESIAGNAPISNYAMVTAIARINDMSSADGLYTESLVAALTQTSDEARARIDAFFATVAGKDGRR